MEYKPLINFLKKQANISIEEELGIRCYFKPEIIRKKTILEHPNSTCRKLYFINSGLLRAFYNNEKGKECTRMIAWEERFLTNMPGFKKFSGAAEIIECLEDAEVMAINKTDFDRLLPTSPVFKNIYCHLLEEYNAVYLNRFQVLSSSDIKYKIQHIKTDYPHLIGRVSDGVLASFLCISRETFVRYKRLMY